ncbi:N-acetylneuraminate synthase family protein [Lewinella sp. 4G2]|uniref:N-acetylneuraminate synthase family protein n=1 Tax=Lewinella sp. 4G2 TaxID=1803372 RepID=UPI0007B478DC|nr:N-acetylneuraminate synthase family protein [Lewinella sp. 4G2]OAV44297.1 hypothetical protein A3850_007230 [Lewinella sp. 4G2]
MIPNTIPYLIGETAFHHQGDVPFLEELIANAVEVGVDAMKFHLTIDLDDYMVSNHEAIEVIRPWCLSANDWSTVLPNVIEQSLDLILLCNDVASLRWVNDSAIPVKAIELHATGLNDYFLLEEAAKFEQTVVLGTGGSTIEEIQYAVDFLRNRGKTDIFLMHGFQNYPTDFKDINLSKMRLLAGLFDLPVGYADHTDPADPDNEAISVMGAAAGFNVLEKHFTHAFGEKRIDAQAAVSVDQLRNVKRLLGKAVAAYGFNDLRMSAAEKKYGDTGPMKKAIVARREIKKGETVSIEDVAFKRTNESAPLKQLDLPKLIGLKAATTIDKDTFIDYSNVEYVYQSNEISQFKNTDS